MRRPQKSCPFCEGRVRWIDYKDDRTLGRFITDQGKILPSRDLHDRGRRLQGSGPGAAAGRAPVTDPAARPRHQRQLSTAIKRARYLAIIPYLKGHTA